MANAIIRFMRSKVDGPRFKYVGHLDIDINDVNQNVGRDVVPTFKRFVMSNKQLRKYYIENNIYNYLDSKWNGAKSRRFILGGQNTIVSGTNSSVSRLTTARLCRLMLKKYLDIDTRTGIGYYPGKYSQADYTRVGCNGSKINTTTLHVGQVFYISLWDLVNDSYKINKLLKQQGVEIIMHYLPVWNLGCWIQIQAIGANNVSRHTKFSKACDKILETAGMVLTGYIKSIGRLDRDGDFQEMFEMIAFNHCYTVARDLGLKISSRYTNQFGGPQEFIFGHNRYISQLYPTLDAVKAKELLMTNVGIYSISLPRDSSAIARIVSQECQRVLRVRDVSRLIITDGTAGVGGDTIAFAREGFKGVNSCEIVAEHCRVVANNVAVFGIDEKVRIVCGDYMNEYHKLKQDVIYLDAPWGGVGYTGSKNENGDGSGLKMFGTGISFSAFIRNVVSNGVSRLIILKVPTDFRSKLLQLDKGKYQIKEIVIGSIRLISMSGK